MGSYKGRVFRYVGERYRRIDGKWYTGNLSSLSAVHSALAFELEGMFSKTFESCKERRDALYDSLILKEFGSLENTCPGEVEILLGTGKYAWLRVMYNEGVFKRKVKYDMLKKAKELGVKPDFNAVYRRKVRKEGSLLQEAKAEANRKAVSNRERKLEKNPELREERDEQLRKNAETGFETNRKRGEEMLGPRLNALYQDVIALEFGGLESMKTGDAARLLKDLPSKYGGFYNEYYKGKNVRSMYYKDLVRLEKRKKQRKQSRNPPL